MCFSVTRAADGVDTIRKLRARVQPQLSRARHLQNSAMSSCRRAGDVHLGKDTTRDQCTIRAILLLNSAMSSCSRAGRCFRAFLSQCAGLVYSVVCFLLLLLLLLPFLLLLLSRFSLCSSCFSSLLLLLPPLLLLYRYSSLRAAAGTWPLLSRWHLATSHVIA